jgi:hypothetical protein
MGPDLQQNPDDAVTIAQACWQSRNIYRGKTAVL